VAIFYFSVFSSLAGVYGRPKALMLAHHPISRKLKLPTAQLKQRRAKIAFCSLDHARGRPLGCLMFGWLDRTTRGGRYGNQSHGWQVFEPAAD